MIGAQQPMNKATVEYFKKKNLPDPYVKSKEFINKKVVQPARRFGRKIINAVSAPFEKEVKIQKNQDDAYRQGAEDLTSGKYIPEKKGRSTSSGYMK